MKTLLQLEAIANDRAEYRRRARRSGTAMPKERERRYLAGDISQPWVAEIIGWSYDRRLTRAFLEPKRDYRNANGVGSRGVMFCYLLEDGRVYEVYERLSWTRTDRYFVRPERGRIVRLPIEEVLQWLSASDRSASMS